MAIDSLLLHAATAYVPSRKCTSKAMRGSVTWKDCVKSEKMVRASEGTAVRASEFLAQLLATQARSGELEGVFPEGCTLVPVPRSGLQKAEALWVGREICLALVRVGLGARVEELLVRTKSLNRSSAQADASKRNTVANHVASLTVPTLLHDGSPIVIVDDIVTRGAQLIGAARVIRSVFPEAQVTGFAAIRTCYKAEDWAKTSEIRFGAISLFESGKVFCDWNLF